MKKNIEENMEMVKINSVGVQLAVQSYRSAKEAVEKNYSFFNAETLEGCKQLYINALVMLQYHIDKAINNCDEEAVEFAKRFIKQ